MQIINGIDVNDLTIEASVRSTGMTFEEQLSQDEKVRHLLRAGDFEKKSYGWRWFPLSGCGRPSLGKVRDVLKDFREAGFKVSKKQKCGTYRMEHSRQITPTIEGLKGGKIIYLEGNPSSGIRFFGENK